jgi:hypothetical protein
MVKSRHVTVIPDWLAEEIKAGQIVSMEVGAAMLVAVNDNNARCAQEVA